MDKNKITHKIGWNMGGRKKHFSLSKKLCNYKDGITILVRKRSMLVVIYLLVRFFSLSHFVVPLQWKMIKSQV